MAEVTLASGPAKEAKQAHALAAARPGAATTGQGCVGSGEALRRSQQMEEGVGMNSFWAFSAPGA
jgi:hypothetical protein